MAKKDPLSVRLYFEEPLYELVRVVGYGGIRSDELDEKLKELIARHGGDVVASAFHELTQESPAAADVTVLKPHVRKLAWQLLGPPPEHPEYGRYWEGRTPPENHQPPKAKEPPKAKRARKKA